MAAFRQKFRHISIPVWVLGITSLLCSCEEKLVHTASEPVPELALESGEGESDALPAASSSTTADSSVEPAPTPLPREFIPSGQLDLSDIYNGIQLEARTETFQGQSSSKERRIQENYSMELLFRIAVPEPVTSVDGLAALNSNLPTVLPGLPALIEQSEVSAFYHGLYENKVKHAQAQIRRINRVLSEQNFYDCETILESTYPESGRKVLLFQSMMDVNGDGSDGDRNIPVDQTSSTFQPFTSYRWPKQTDRPNEFMQGRQERLKELEERFAAPGLSIEENRQLRAEIDRTKLEIADMETFSYLVSRADPYIVMPGFALRDRSLPFAPRFGDYAVVIHEDKIYPTILGDAGPSHKIGEASLRICREINENSGPLRRPVTALEVTYLIFPGTAEDTQGPPDLKLMVERCKALLEEIGGHAGTLQEWENLALDAEADSESAEEASAPADSDGSATEAP